MQALPPTRPLLGVQLDRNRDLSGDHFLVEEEEDCLRGPKYYTALIGIKQGKLLVDDVSVTVKAGELLAIMGPSGAGITSATSLRTHRLTSFAPGKVKLNGVALNASTMQQMSTFVEQEDALLGVLTVRESVSYALRLQYGDCSQCILDLTLVPFTHSLPMLSRREVADRVNRVLTALGLQSCANQRIGTPISRGISGGQKRRVTAACAMVTFPRILLLDEVASGLDSTSAREVMSAIRTLAVAEGIIVIATIHQPSLETLAQFTDILLLAEGCTCFSGKVGELEGFLERWGHPVGKFTTPSDHAMNFLNEDFAETTGRESSNSARAFREFYLSTKPSLPDDAFNADLGGNFGGSATEHSRAGTLGTLFWNTMVLSERTTVNYSRNLLAYGVRAGMYAGMGLMLATIWIRLGTNDSTINDRLSVHFFSVAFLAFDARPHIRPFCWVLIPAAVLEERAVYYRETKNGLYSTLPFVLSNTLVNMPFLFISTLLFTLISYWAIGLHPGGAAFFRFLAFLYFAILAAESQMLIIAALLPIFVAALAIGAFVNGFWMSVGGYFIKARSLPRFWFFSFHYMDYQRYAFELLTNSDLRGLTFKCESTVNGACVCAYPSSTPETCTVSGADVLNYLDIGDISYGAWAGIVIAITVIYRIAFVSHSLL
ncbi:P-loop containing nucleoside triphosphate hydrolase protein [Mycena rosella]|uniref:P-loop containing nucleoside triphosphate hydrolase protein n=1 Tax=Mycena rosella TaxID=1033263 RepID=A0AAD7DJP1_MYCRO|nr:P-loop containing nucleoside triphosphate hydrolase protein [Mycena rosella]